MNCGMNEFRNGARDLMLLLRKQVHLGVKQLSVFKVESLFVRRRKNNP